MASLGPWSSHSSQDLGPWSASSLVGDCQKAAPKKKAHYVPKKSSSVKELGPWTACGLGTPTESRSQAKVSGTPHKPSQKRQAASQGVEESKTWGPWGNTILKRQASTSDQGASERSTRRKKAPRIDLTQACVMDIPHHVRGHSTQINKRMERAKDPKAIKARYSGKGRCACACTETGRLHHVTAGCQWPRYFICAVL